MSLRTDYDSWHQRIYEADPGHDDSSSPRYQLVLEYLGDVSGLAILEVACGRGGFVCQLSRSGARVTGCDFSASALRAAHAKLAFSNGLLPASLIQGDAQSLPSPTLPSMPSSPAKLSSISLAFWTPSVKCTESLAPAPASCSLPLTISISWAFTSCMSASAIGLARTTNLSTAASGSRKCATGFAAPAGPLSAPTASTMNFLSSPSETPSAGKLWTPIGLCASSSAHLLITFS